MRNINNTFSEEKNSDRNKPLFLYIIYDYNGAGDNLYFTNWTENVTYDGQTYTRFPISHESITEDSSGEIGNVQVTLSNVSRLIQAYLENYDFRRKKVVIKQVWANQLSDVDANISDTYYIDSYTADQQNVTFTLTGKFDVLSLELPARKYSRNYCAFKFKSSECGYSGSETSCNKTLARCRQLGNSTRFGGFSSIPSTRTYIS